MLRKRIIITQNCCSKHIGHGFQPKNAMVNIITAIAPTQTSMFIGSIKLANFFHLLLVYTA